MRCESRRPSAFPCRFVLLSLTAFASAQVPDSSSVPSVVVVPKLWDAASLVGWATPLAGLGEPPSFVSEADYYAAPIDDLRTYPVYHPSREPAGYRESLLRLGPRPLIEPEHQKTMADWIEAGRLVFEQLDTPASRTDDPEVIAHFSDAKAVDACRDEHHDVVDRNGVVLDYRWVVGRDGVLRMSLSSCAGCHTRLMPDGSTLSGAPSNFDLGDSVATRKLLAPLRLMPKRSRGEEFYAQFGVPWLGDRDLHRRFATMSNAEFAAQAPRDDGAPPGTTFARFGGSPFFVARMADLRGVRDRRYLDTTATHLNRGPADIARYGILVEYAESGVFGPHHLLPADAKLSVRPSDAAMYALALYVDSLDPAPSPHPFDARAQRGKQVFESEGCAKCHAPPLYTNNKLIAAPGFEAQENARELGLEVSKRRVHTDPGQTLLTRKGTGYYRVPTLRGLWYRGLYEHSGSVASLEDWFDPRRLRSDYVPTGWRGPGVERRAVVGHDFGLDLDAADKADLIAFLRTL